MTKILPITSNIMEVEIMDKDNPVIDDRDHINVALKIVYTLESIQIIQPRYQCDLQTFLSTNPSSDTLSNIVRDIVFGIKTLHKNSVVHGDIKPRNILISDDCRAIIADFGHSRLIGSHNYGMAGTVCYQALEILNGEQWNEKIDIWSLGCLIYCMVYGHPIFPFQKRLKKKCAHYATLDFIHRYGVDDDRKVIDTNSFETNFYYYTDDTIVNEDVLHSDKIFKMLRIYPDDRISIEDL